MDDNYWSPPHEEFESQKVSRSVKNILSSWQTYQEIDEYTLDKELLSYLDDRNTEKMEFVIHPGFWEYGYRDPESNFIDDFREENEILDHEEYLNRLTNRLSNAVEDGHPIFALHPPNFRQDETTRAYMEQSFGLSNEDYKIIETNSENGLISYDNYGKLFAIIEEDSFEARVSGEVAGLCPVQFEATLASISEATDLADIQITEGQKFPEKTVRNIGLPLLETKWTLIENIDYDQARHSFENFLITELPKELGRAKENEEPTINPSMSGRYRKQ